VTRIDVEVAHEQPSSRWYAANDGSIRSKATMYFVLHPPLAKL
jgi:hypothetical protein